MIRFELGHLAALVGAATMPFVVAGGVHGQSGQLGQALVIDGQQILVGEPSSNFRPGAIYVYRKGTDGWTRGQTIRAPQPERADGFGDALTLNDGTLFAGQGERIHVFAGSGESWNAVQAIEAPRADERFATAVASAGDWLLVGAPATQVGGRGGRGGGGGRGGQQEAPPAGAVYAFQRDGSGQWVQRSRIVPAASAAGDAFGTAIAIDGETALVGAPGAAGRAGTVVVYRLSGSEWREAGTLPAAGLVGNDRFGMAISLDGRTALVGAPGMGEGRGAALVFTADASGAWSVGPRLESGALDRRDAFGSAVALNGPDAWVGAPSPPGNLTGRVAVFRDIAGGSAGPGRVLVAPASDARDAFGARLAVEGDVAAVSATGMDHGAGAVIVYARSAGGEWAEDGVLLSEPDNLAGVTGGERRCDAEGVAADLFDCRDVELLSLATPSMLAMPDQGRGVRLNDVWGWTDPETGREYALVGRVDGTSFVDITDPVNPVLIGDLPQTPGGPPSPIWRDIKTYANHAFIVADAAGEHGMQVFDLTQLRRAGDEPVTFTPTTVYRRMNSAHNIVINEASGFAYIVGASAGGETCGGGLHMVDIRDPRNPGFAGCFTHADPNRDGRGYTHDAQCVTYHGPDERYADHEICIGSNERSLSIADVTDKSSPSPVSRVSYPNPAYTHQGWFTEDHRYYFVDDETDEIAGSADRTRTLVYDLTDLEDPRLQLEWFGTTSASDHNLYIRDNLMYQSNYRAGLRIIDVSDPDAPVEVAHFDTAPYLEDAPGFSGTWSNYPFFPSGTVIVTSVQEGLFILKKRERPVS